MLDIERFRQLFAADCIFLAGFLRSARAAGVMSSAGGMTIEALMLLAE